MLEIACDGSTLGNPGPSGWGWYLSEDCWAAGGAVHSTNQAMELSAVLDYLQSTEHLPPATPVTLILDSQYAINCLSKWAVNWRRNGWKNSKGDPVVNRALIEPALDLLKGRTGTKFQWVKGHAGHPLNVKADEKCTKASAAVAAGLAVPRGPGWTLDQPAKSEVSPAEVTPAQRTPAQRTPAQLSPEQIFDTLF